MKQQSIAFAIFTLAALFLIGITIPTVFIKNDNNIPDEYLTDAQSCFDNPISRIFNLKLQLQNFDSQKQSATFKSYTFFGIPTQTIRVTNGSTTCNSK